VIIVIVLAQAAECLSTDNAMYQTETIEQIIIICDLTGGLE
jgi:hypothetical protein